MSTDSLIHVSQMGPDVLRVRTVEGYEVSVMIHINGADVFVSALDGSETVRLKLEGPKPGQRITVKRNVNGSVDVVYAE